MPAQGSQQPSGAARRGGRRLCPQQACWEGPRALAGGRDVNGGRARSATARAVRKAQRRRRKATEGKRRVTASQTEPSCLPTAPLMAFSVQEGFGDLGSRLINARSTCPGGPAARVGARGLGEQPSPNAAACGTKEPTPPRSLRLLRFSHKTLLPGRKALDGLKNPLPETLACLNVAGQRGERGRGRCSPRGSVGGRPRPEACAAARVGSTAPGRPRCPLPALPWAALLRRTGLDPRSSRGWPVLPAAGLGRGGQPGAQGTGLFFPMQGDSPCTHPRV